MLKMGPGGGKPVFCANSLCTVPYYHCIVLFLLLIWNLLEQTYQKFAIVSFFYLGKLRNGHICNLRSSNINRATQLMGDTEEQQQESAIHSPLPCLALISRRLATEKARASRLPEHMSDISLLTGLSGVSKTISEGVNTCVNKQRSKGYHC